MEYLWTLLTLLQLDSRVKLKTKTKRMIDQHLTGLCTTIFHHTPLLNLGHYQRVMGQSTSLFFNNGGKISKSSGVSWTPETDTLMLLSSPNRRTWLSGMVQSFFTISSSKQSVFPQLIQGSPSSVAMCMSTFDPSSIVTVPARQQMTHMAFLETLAPP